MEALIALSWSAPGARETRVQLQAQAGAASQTVDAVKGPDGKYRALFTPLLGQEAVAQLRATLQFETGEIAGTISDHPISVDGKPTPLSKLEVIQRAAKGSGFTVGGKAIGALPELAALQIDMGDGRGRTIDARKATKIEIQKLDGLPTVLCKVVTTMADGSVLTSEEKQLQIRSVPSLPGREIQEPTALKAERTVLLPGAVTDVAAAENGRTLLLYLKESRKLAVFDVAALKIRGIIPLKEENILFAGGARCILIGYPQAKVIESYSLQTLQKDRTAALPVEHPYSLTMGYAASTALLLNARDRVGFTNDALLFDADTLAPEGEKLEVSDMQLERAAVRCSADGGIYAVRCLYNVVALTTKGGHLARSGKDGREEVWDVEPSADGSYFLSSNNWVFTNQWTPSVSVEGTLGVGTWFMPTYHPMYFLGVPYSYFPDRQESPHGQPIGIYLTGSTQSLLEIPNPFKGGLAGYDGFRNGTDPLTLDKRIHFCPQMNLLLSIPQTNDRIIAQPVNVRELLKAKGGNYLYVDSVPPPPAKAGTHFHFRLEAASDAASVKFALQSGPPGLTVSKDGVVDWPSPAQAQDEAVIVLLTNGAGREAYYKFRLATTP